MIVFACEMPLEANINIKSGKVTVIPVQDRDDIGPRSFDFVLRTPLRMTDEAVLDPIVASLLQGDIGMRSRGVAETPAARS